MGPPPVVTYAWPLTFDLSFLSSVLVKASRTLLVSFDPLLVGPKPAKNGILPKNYLLVHGLVRFFEKEESTFFPDGVIHGLDSIDDIPLLCAQKHAVYKISRFSKLTEEDRVCLYVHFSNIHKPITLTSYPATGVHVIVIGFLVPASIIPCVMDWSIFCYFTVGLTGQTKC